MAVNPSFFFCSLLFTAYFLLVFVGLHKRIEGCKDFIFIEGICHYSSHVEHTFVGVGETCISASIEKFKMNYLSLVKKKYNSQDQ